MAHKTYLCELPTLEFVCLFGDVSVTAAYSYHLGCEDMEDTAIVRMIVELAHTLGMRIIGEGVESEEQAEELREMGCDLGQGFHFAERLSTEEASSYYRGNPYWGEEQLNGAEVQYREGYERVRVPTLGGPGPVLAAG